MGKIDKIKEDVGAFKTYQGFIVALVIAIGAGVAKLYLENNISYLFFIGIAFIIACSIAFALIAERMHKKINELEEL